MEAPAALDGQQLLVNLFKMVAFLGGLCALGYLSVRVLGPRLSPLGGKPNDLIRVVDMKRLDPHTTVYLVEVGGRHALIGTSQTAGVQALSKVELDDELIREKAKLRDTAAFAHVLSKKKV